MTNPMSQSDKIREALLLNITEAMKAFELCPMDERNSRFITCYRQLEKAIDNFGKLSALTPAPEAGTERAKLEYDPKCPECERGYPETCPVCQLDGHPAVDKRDNRIKGLLEQITQLESQLSRPQGSEALKALMEAADFDHVQKWTSCGWQCGWCRTGSTVHEPACPIKKLKNALAQLKKEQG